MTPSSDPKPQIVAAAPSTASLLDESARDELVLKHLDLVPRVVNRLPISLPSGLDRDDLLSAGTIGLLGAARTFQPLRGASFKTYAWLAIRAAVLDELRRHDPLPRGARSRFKELFRLESEYRSVQGRPPLPEEIAEALSLTSEETEELLARVEEDRLLRAPHALGGGGDDDDGEGGAFHGGGDSFVDPSAPEPMNEAARHELLERIEQAIRELPDRERQVVVLYHGESLYLKEIGEVLGVSESRICQILAVTQQKIRARVEGRTA